MDAALATIVDRTPTVTWRHLQRALLTAANGVLLATPSPMTPGRGAAEDLHAAAQRRVERHPGNLQSATALREANTARARARTAHEAHKRRRLFAAVQGERPARRMIAVYRYLRRTRRSGGPRPQGLTIRDWEAYVQRLAAGEQGTGASSPQPPWTDVPCTHG